MDVVLLSRLVDVRCLMDLRLWLVDHKGSSFVDLASSRTGSNRRRILRSLLVRPSSWMKICSRPPDSVVSLRYGSCSLHRSSRFQTRLNLNACSIAIIEDGPYGVKVDGFGVQLLSSLNSSSLSSASSSERPLDIQCASYYHSVSSPRVSYLLKSQLSPLSLEVCDNLLGLMSRLISPSLIILLLDVGVIILFSILDLCEYSPIILPLDVYFTLMGLVSVSIQNELICKCSAQFSPLSRSLFICSPLHKIDLILLIDYILRLRLNYRLVCCRVLYLMNVTSALGPITPSVSPWRVFRCLCDARSAFGWKGLCTDDPLSSLSVSLKGSTLISAADCKIDKSVLVAASITEVSSVTVILSSDGIIFLLRSYGDEIQRRLYIVCYFGTMFASILCVFSLRVQLVAAMLVMVMTLSVTLVNNSSYGEFEV